MQIKNKKTNKIALISTPWPVYNRPSIQLGALKAALTKELPNLCVDAHHFYLNVAEKTDFRIYAEISEKSWLAESVYAALLFPENKDEISDFFKKESKGNKILRTTTFDNIIHTVKAVSDKLVSDIDWSSYLFAGFSVCLCQLTSSLYFIRRIKEAYPNLPVICGGSLLSGLNPDDVFKSFSDIDVLINGEGELPLTNLTRQLLKNTEISEVKPAAGLFSRYSASTEISRFNQIRTMDTLPVPDFDDYFKTLEILPPAKRFFPTLPAEMSRGCWWNKKSENNDSGCAFCNLNLQWKGYRSKSIERITKEIDFLTTKHKLLSVNFMDNLIPLKKSEAVFQNLAAAKKDLSLFCEIRANTSYENLITMKKAGVKYVQIGIEGLSSSLLYKINKGTTAIQNLEIMKHCEATGIENNSNLILHFPESDKDDVDETLNALDFAEIFRPLKTVRFQLGLGSPVMNAHKAFGIKSVGNHINYKLIFPKSITSTLQFINLSYKGDISVQKKLWHPVKQRVLKWESSYNKLHSTPGSGPILSYQDGGSFVIIRRRRINKESETHRLTGPSRAIFLFCEKTNHFDEIKKAFPQLSPQALFSFLTMMTEKKLMFHEDDYYLSLACRY